MPFLAVAQTFDWAAEISGTIRSLFQIQCSQRNFLCRHLAVQTFDWPQKFLEPSDLYSKYKIVHGNLDGSLAM